MKSAEFSGERETSETPEQVRQRAILAIEDALVQLDEARNVLMRASSALAAARLPSTEARDRLAFVLTELHAVRRLAAEHDPERTPVVPSPLERETVRVPPPPRVPTIRSMPAPPSDRMPAPRKR